MAAPRPFDEIVGELGGDKTELARILETLMYDNLVRKVEGRLQLTENGRDFKSVLGPLRTWERKWTRP
jgi:DNA-binding HxlR family transcriptional regulator